MSDFLEWNTTKRTRGVYRISRCYQNHRKGSWTPSRCSGMNAIMSQARVVILEVLKTQWIHLAIEKVGNKEVVKIKGRQQLGYTLNGWMKRNFGNISDSKHLQKLSQLSMVSNTNSSRLDNNSKHASKPLSDDTEMTEKSLSRSIRRAQEMAYQAFELEIKLQDIIGYHTFSINSSITLFSQLSELLLSP